MNYKNIECILYLKIITIYYSNIISNAMQTYQDCLIHYYK